MLEAFRGRNVGGFQGEREVTSRQKKACRTEGIHWEKEINSEELDLLNIDFSEVSGCTNNLIVDVSINGQTESIKIDTGR
ncbi:hypothetical protein PR048_011820 [Dryococelus australis]|uniref:Uncharacterized protein n=1 Tax=Dryococelus australis TaxID=614101 RepID=A0ABQ9HMZ4_9NEOP|nr:hypothetical protein PR048_011820 [Dryococelus australis]